MLIPRNLIHLQEIELKSNIVSVYWIRAVLYSTVFMHLAGLVWRPGQYLWDLWWLEWH
jgi:hypothetical protein